MVPGACGHPRTLFSHTDPARFAVKTFVEKRPGRAAGATERSKQHNTVKISELLGPGIDWYEALLILYFPTLTLASAAGHTTLIACSVRVHVQRYRRTERIGAHSSSISSTLVSQRTQWAKVSLMR